MAQNRKNVAYIKLPYGVVNRQKAKVTKVGKMAVICTQKNEKIKEEILPKTVTKHNGENF